MELGYNPMGQEIQREVRGGVQSTFQYDLSGRRTQEVTNVRGRRVVDRRYEWDVNRLKTVSEPLGQNRAVFSYDKIGNLAGGTYDSYQFVSRTPDEVGNFYRSHDRQDRRYGANGQLLESSDYQYSYDGEGNLIEKIRKGNPLRNIPDKQWKYSYYGNVTLKSVITPDGTEERYSYDILG